MPMQIRGNTQIISGSITSDRLAASLGLATNQLAEGADFIKRTGGVAYTADQPMGGFQLTGLGTPTLADHAATKGYVDSMSAGLDAKQSVRVATTGPITLTGTQTIDGVALSAGNRVLVKNQAAPAANGIYVVAAGAWTRALDADTDAEVNPGMFTFVEEGTVNADSGWVLSTDGAVSLGTTSLTFVQFSSAASLTAGAGLAQTGNVFNIVNSDNSLTVAADDLSVKRDAAGAIGVSASGLAVNVGTGIEISSNALRIAAGAAGDGLGYAAGVLSINTGTGLELVADAIRISSAAAGDGLGYTTGVLSVNVGAATGLAIVSDAVGIKLDGTSLALSASGIKMADPGAGKLVMGGASGAVAYNTMSGDATISNTGVVSVATTIARKVDHVGTETLTGTPNGVLTAFGLGATPITGTLSVFINGIMQKPTTDYTVSGSTVTFVSAPATGDWVSASYMK